MTKQIQLTKGKFTEIDDSDFEQVNAFKWYATKVKKGKNLKWYAMRSVGKFPIRNKIFLHRFIMNAPKGMDVDHIDGDGLNNHRGNLRLATRSQNMQNRGKPANNTSGFKGVDFNSGKWRMLIQIDGKQFCIFGFRTAEEAARAYDKKAKEHFGKFAQLNFPES